VSAGVILLYFLPYFSTNPLKQAFIVTIPVLIIASVTAVTSIITYLWIPKKVTMQAALLI
jgi:hypothetical protein